MTDDSLKGWKEISTFLGASERTAQRWESELALPVHRLSARPGAGVFALPEELVAWRSSTAGQVAARQEAERTEREAAATVASPGSDGSAAVADTAAPSNPVLHAVPAARRHWRLVLLLLVAGLFAAGLFAAWSVLLRTPVSSPQPTAAPINPVRLRIVWTNGFSIWAAIPDGGKARITVGTQLLEFSAKRMESVVKVGVAEVRPGGTPGQGDSVSFLGQFVLQPGVTARVQEPSPFSIEWVPPETNKSGPVAR